MILLASVRSTRRHLITVLLVGATSLMLVPSAQAAIMIQGDVKLGRFEVKRDGTLQGAIEAFGRPTTLRRDRRFREICYARWSGIGLRITFYNLGGQNPCRAQWGYFSRAEIVGRDWQTRAGLRIGDPLRRLWARYPRAEPHPPYWWLVVRRSPFGDRGSYAGLSAKIRDGRVVAFVVRYPAGGD
jgi:hypothetical protein